MTTCVNPQDVTFSDAFTCMYNAATGALSSRSTLLVDEGLDLAIVLLLITVTWAVLMWMLSSDGMTALQQVTKTFVRYSIVALMLTSWAAFTTSFFQTNINQIAQKVAGTSDVGASSNLLYQAAVQLFKGEQAPQCSQTAPIQVEAGIDPGYQADPCGAKSAPSVSDMLFFFPKIIMAMLLKLAAVFCLALTLIAYVLAILMAQVMFGIGVALGPILVPWLVWERTEFLFDGWLRFMIAAAFTKIVAALMVAMTADIFVVVRSIANTVDGATGYSTVDLVAAFMMAVVSALAAFMMWQVQGIAQSLVSGGGGVSSKGFGNGLMSRNLRSMGTGALSKITQLAKK